MKRRNIFIVFAVIIISIIVYFMMDYEKYKIVDTTAFNHEISNRYDIKTAEELAITYEKFIDTYSKPPYRITKEV
jgi:hypothetical protein